ncbi:proline dehydrogenase family protein [Marihabitans asiaticum]|uniref:L-proline dehydrogenase n=1 Tax=Marihabitans asiaticum TaxID=415218 RepID=A0A560WD96_9MICO|nr:hypothetical protein [Marihabitans asiaticum]TWD15649.1 L-proline dehydrogenase [Marihabitans asiaticum]
MSMLPTSAGLRAAVVDVLTVPPVRSRVSASGLVHAARERFVAGPVLDDALDTAADLGRTTRAAAIQPLCVPADDEATCAANRSVAQECLAAIAALPPGTQRPDVFLSPAVLGLGVSPPGVLSTYLTGLAESAGAAGVSITLRSAPAGLDGELVDLVTSVTGSTGAKGGPSPLRTTVLTRRHRAEEDCSRLVDAGVAVRLVRGGPRESGHTAWTDRHEADLAFVRCLSVALTGDAGPMVATQDPVLLEVIDAMAEQHGRHRDLEYQLYLGVQPDLQVRLADAGHRVRVLVPYGSDWYAYLADLIERPSTTRRMLSALTGRG